MKLHLLTIDLTPAAAESGDETPLAGAGLPILSLLALLRQYGPVVLELIREYGPKLKELVARLKELFAGQQPAPTVP